MPQMLWKSLNNVFTEDDLIGTLTSKTLTEYKNLILPCDISYSWVKKNLM